MDSTIKEGLIRTMGQPRFKINDLVEYYCDEEFTFGRIIDIHTRNDVVWYKIKTQFDEIDFVTEDQLDPCDATT